MTRLALTFLLFTSVCRFVCAQAEHPSKVVIDPVSVSPDKYKVLLENDLVRVIRYTLKPGERDNPHTHPPRLSYAISGGKFRIHQEGQSPLDLDEATGTTEWNEYSGLHTAENIGSSTITILLTEVKAGATTDTSEDNVKDAVWAMEEQYWKYVKQKDYKSYLTLWHDRFIGYPSTNVIGNKEHITDWMTDLYKTSGEFNYELMRKVENVFGNIVVVLYDVSYTFTSGEGKVLRKANFKITHTWEKSEKGWLIIGGMGANKE